MTTPDTDFAPAERQRAAIEAPFGPVLVVAGPGAGKTFCLIERVAHLVETCQVLPERICAVTFTNKAAEEIAARLDRKLGSAARAVTRGTLHALCLSLLREFGGVLDVRRDFGIADDAYQEVVLRRLGVPRGRWSGLLSHFARKRFRAAVLDPEDQSLFRQYEAYLRERNLLDFDQLIVKTDELFRQQSDVLAAVRSRWEHILVDEFQDLNVVQYSVIQQLAGEHRNLFVVGDDEQSIFSWTGADPELLDAFRRDFGVDQPIVLDRNHRCARQIFEVACRILAENRSLFDKDVRAERESDYEVESRSFPTDDAEADWLLHDLVRDRDESDGDWGDYAILYRRHRLGEELEKRFVHAGVPCRVARGRALRDDKVVGYVVASLQLILTPDDATAVEAFTKRVLSGPLLEQVQALVPATERFLDALRAYAARHARTEPDTKKVWRCIYHIENLPALGQTHETLAGLVEELLSQRVGQYQNPLEEHHDELSDPASYPGAAELADRIAEAAEEKRRVWVEPDGGLGIALRGMLAGAGGVAVGYLGPEAAPAADDVVLPASPGASLPLLVFKALQILQSRHFGDVFQDYVAFDLETTDKDPATCDIVEIGAVRVRGGKVGERFHAYVRPTQPISPGAQQVHGYSDDDLADEPPFSDVWPRFREFVGSDLLVAHNGHKFDVPVLRRLASGMEGIDEMVFFDTLPLAKSLSPESGKLEDLAARFGIETGRSHHAEDDAVTLAHVLSSLGERKVARARKASLINVLDFLGMALVLDPRRVRTDEEDLLSQLARPYALGRYSHCLEFYAEQRDLGGLEAQSPPIEEVIARLGGEQLIHRLRATRTARQRYPEAMRRLQALITSSEGPALDGAIRSLLERVALSTSDGVDLEPHRVNLLTLHATKGLEFAKVYIAGVEDYQIPGYYQMEDNRIDEIEEARRLLYVGMTRARDRLVLTYAEARQGKYSGGRQFLNELGLDPEPVSAIEPADR